MKVYEAIKNFKYYTVSTGKGLLAINNANEKLLTKEVRKTRIIKGMYADVKVIFI